MFSLLFIGWEFLGLFFFFFLFLIDLRFNTIKCGLELLVGKLGDLFFVLLLFYYC